MNEAVVIPAVQNAGDEAAPNAEVDETISHNGAGEENSSSSSSSSTSSESERPVHKRKHCRSTDPRIDALITQVSYLSNLCMQSLGGSYQSDLTQNNSNEAPTGFITNPNVGRKTLELGKIETDFNRSKMTKTAAPDRVRQIKELQHFGDPLWKHIRYSKSLQTFAATPAFVELKLNDELCHLNKEKDFLAGTEAVVAGLSNAVLEQRELLRSGLQSIVDWAFQSPQDLNAQNLFEKISNSFGSNSDTYKNIEETLQVICGKRAECVETRRERILKQISNKPIQAALRNIPPSVEHLFDKEKLLPLIQSLGGPQTWLNPALPKDPKFSLKRKQGELGQSTSTFNPKRFKYPRNSKNYDRQGKGQGKKSTFRSQSEGTPRNQPK